MFPVWKNCITWGASPSPSSSFQRKVKQGPFQNYKKKQQHVPPTWKEHYEAYVIFFPYFIAITIIISQYKTVTALSYTTTILLTWQTSVLVETFIFFVRVQKHEHYGLEEDDEEYDDDDDDEGSKKKSIYYSSHACISKCRSKTNFSFFLPPRTFMVSRETVLALPLALVPHICILPKQPQKIEWCEE